MYYLSESNAQNKSSKSLKRPYPQPPYWNHATQKIYICQYESLTNCNRRGYETKVKEQYIPCRVLIQNSE